MIKIIITIIVTIITIVTITSIIIVANVLIFKANKEQKIYNHKEKQRDNTRNE